MSFRFDILCAALMTVLFGCGKKNEGHKDAAISWTPILGTCADQIKTCYLSDQASGLIWSQTFPTARSQNEADAHCRSLNMRLPTFREYAFAARDGLLDASQVFPAFGVIESLLWTSEPQTYIAFGDNTAAKRQGSAPALFKCVTGEGLPSTTPRTASGPAPSAPVSRTPQASSCQELQSLEQCSTNALCVWTHRGCTGIEGMIENPQPQ